jgi:1,4-dihydroxy-2-naphthoate polyprenyltransferase
MNFAMWKKALEVIPAVSKEEWDALDIISKWLISTRAAVLVMTFLSAALAGLFAYRDNLDKPFNWVAWIALTLGLVLAHATNNLFNDYTDFVKGVDKDNYFRTMYGPQPVANGLMTTTQLLIYTAVTGAVAAAFGIYLIAANGWDTNIWILLGLGAFFVLFYTWPLKYIAMGEIAVLLVWGPLMIGGGYYVLTGGWDWNVVWACVPYYFGVTTVIFGKHIDKIEIDHAKKIYTLPVILGEKLSRYTVIFMMVAPYILVAALVALKYFTPVMLIVALAIPSLRQTLPYFTKPRPSERPEWFPDGQGGWPLFFAPLAFRNNRAFGGLFLLGLLVDVLLRAFGMAGWWA